MAFYLEILSAQKVRPEDLLVAQKTYELVGERIRKTDGKVEQTRIKEMRSEVEKEYLKSRNAVLDVLKSAGILAKSVAALLIEKSLVVTLLFYAAVTGVKYVKDLLWCIFPFCFQRPA